VYDLSETPLQGSCDVFMHEESPSLGFDDSVFHNPLNHSHTFPLCSMPYPSLEYYIDVPINNPMIFYANVNLGYDDSMFRNS